jgi:hypothetical protein
MNSEEQQDVLNIGKLVIYKNALIYENSVVQISNICSIWVADHSYEIHNNIPIWIKLFAILGGIALVGGIVDEQGVFIVLALAMLGIAGYGFFKHKPKTPIAKYALGVERASGRVMLFTAPDKRFVQDSAKALMEAISEKKTSKEVTVMNFDNKEINIENAIGSNVIGGNVSDSLVESLI